MGFLSRKFLLVALSLLFIFIRLYHFSEPLTSHLPAKQIFTAMQAKAYYNNSTSDYFLPKIEQLKKNSTEKIVWMDEYPLYAYVISLFYKAFGFHEYWGRIVSLFFSFLSFIFLFLLLSHYFSKKEVYWTLFFYAINPIHWYYSSAFQSEMAMLSCCIATLYFSLLWLKNKSLLNYILGVFFLALAVLFKLPAVYCIVPLLYLTVLYKNFLSLRTFFLIFTVFVLCYTYMLLSQISGVEGGRQLLKIGFSFASFLHHGFSFSDLLSQFWVRIHQYGVTYVGLLFLFLGLFSKQLLTNKLFYIWGGSWLLFIFCFPSHYIIHEYYHLAFVPLMSLLAGIGINSFMSFLKNEKVAIGVTVTLIVTLFIMSSKHVYKFYRTNNTPLHAAALLQKFTIASDKILFINCDYDFGPAFSYYGQREGWYFESDFASENQDSLFKKYSALGSSYVFYCSSDRDFHAPPFFNFLLKNRNYELISTRSGEFGKEKKMNFLKYYIYPNSRSRDYTSLYLFKKL